jgi:hypothetical protein
VGLREQAAADNRAILEDSAAGFGWPMTVTSPGGTDTAAIVGYSNDISQAIDADTGMLVSGRTVSCTLSIASLAAAGLGIPQGIADSNARPWVIEFSDVGGRSYRLKVRESRPDRALNCVLCILEDFR